MKKLHACFGVLSALALVVACSSSSSDQPAGSANPDAAAGTSGGPGSSSGGDAATGPGSSSGGDDGGDAGGGLTLLAQFDTGGTVTGMVRSLFEKRYYVAVKTSPTTGNVLVIDTTTRKKVGTIDVGGAPTNIVVHNDADAKIFVTAGGCDVASGAIVVIDGPGMNVTKTTPSPTGFGAGMAYLSSPTGERLYANPCGANKIQEYDATTGAATAKSFATTGAVVGLSAYSGGQLYWFGNDGGQAKLLKIDVGTSQTTTLTYPGTARSVSAVLTTPNQAVIVTSSPDTAQLVDPQTLKLPSGFVPYGGGYTVVPVDGGSKPEICVGGCHGALRGLACYDLSGNPLPYEEWKSSDGACDAQQGAFFELSSDGFWIQHGGTVYVFVAP